MDNNNYNNNSDNNNGFFIFNTQNRDTIYDNHLFENENNNNNLLVESRVTEPSIANAQEWLDKNIPTDKRWVVKFLIISQQSNDVQLQISPHIQPQELLKFLNTTLVGELDLNDFISLEVLFILGDSNQVKEQQQRITNLKIDKCAKLNVLQICYTILDKLDVSRSLVLKILDCSFNQLVSLDISNNQYLQTLNCISNKINTLYFDVNPYLTSITKDASTRLSPVSLSLEEILKEEKKGYAQKELLDLALSSNEFNSNEFKTEFRKICIKDLTFQLENKKEKLKEVVNKIKNKLSESAKKWLDVLVEVQQEVLQNDTPFVHSQLEKAKGVLIENLTKEEIQKISDYVVNKQLEINFDSSRLEQLVRKGKAEEKLFEAVEEGNFELVEKIIDEEGFDINNVRDELGNTSLHFAAEENNFKILKSLVEKGGNINSVNKYNWSVLHSVASGIVNKKGSWGIMEWVLQQKNLDIDIETKSGLTARDVLAKKDYSYAEHYDKLVEKFFLQDLMEIN